MIGYEDEVCVGSEVRIEVGIGTAVDVDTKDKVEDGNGNEDEGGSEVGNERVDCPFDVCFVVVDVSCPPPAGELVVVVNEVPGCGIVKQSSTSPGCTVNWPEKPTLPTLSVTTSLRTFPTG